MKKVLDKTSIDAIIEGICFLRQNSTHSHVCTQWLYAKEHIVPLVGGELTTVFLEKTRVPIHRILTPVER